MFIWHIERGHFAEGNMFDLQNWESRVLTGDSAAHSQAVARLIVDFHAAPCVPPPPRCPSAALQMSAVPLGCSAPRSAFLVVRVTRDKDHLKFLIGFNSLWLAEFWTCSSRLKLRCSNQGRPEGGGIFRNYCEMWRYKRQMLNIDIIH